MGYGLKITGPNEQFILDSDLPGARHLAIVSGPVESNLGTSYSGAYAGFQTGDLVFARPKDGAGKIFADFTTATTLNPPKISGRNNDFHGENQKYFIVRPSANSGHSLNQNSSTYGLRVLDANGNDVMYDSRQTSKNIDIQAVKGYFSCNGGGTGTSRNDTDNTNIIYGSKTSDTYACMNPCNTYNTTYLGINHNLFQGYDFEGNNVRYVGWYRITYANAGPFSGATTFPMKNWAELIVGDLVE